MFPTTIKVGVSVHLSILKLVLKRWFICNDPDGLGLGIPSLLTKLTRPNCARTRWRFTGAYLDFAVRFIWQSCRLGYVLTQGAKNECTASVGPNVLSLTQVVGSETYRSMQHIKQ